MLRKRVCKIAALMLFACFTVWQSVGYPNYMTQYATDPRARPEYRSNCAICHAPDGRRAEANFLTEFGRAFKANQNRISAEMRDRFTDLFFPADRPVGGVPTETLKLTTEQVLVNISVQDAKGKYVSGLDREAFTLSEDGQKQEIMDFLGEDAPMAVAVLLDTSGSSIDKDLERASKAIMDLAYRLRPDDSLAIYTFGEGGVQQVREFASSVRDLKPILKQLKGAGDTPLFDAVLKATEDLRQRPERRRIAILLSDGGDSASQATLRQAERETFQAGVSIYSIDLINTEKSAKRSAQRQAAAQILRQLAEETGGRYITTEGGSWWRTNRSKLRRIFTDLIDELHQQYTLAYEPANPRRAGRWRTIKIQLEQADLTARTRLGYREGVQ